MQLIELLTPFAPENRARPPARKKNSRRTTPMSAARRRNLITNKKLTEDQVREMRRLKPYDPANKTWLDQPEPRYTVTSLAAKYDVAPGTVYKVLTYEQWKDI